MKKEVVIQLHSQFERIVHIVNDSEVELWYARELQRHWAMIAGKF